MKDTITQKKKKNWKKKKQELKTISEYIHKVIKRDNKEIQWDYL